MASSGQYARIHEAFSQDANLRKRIFDTIGRWHASARNRPFSNGRPTDDHPETVGLFEDIAKYHEGHRSQATNGVPRAPDEPLTKKRRLEENGLPVRGNAPLAFQAKDLSFTIPQRKKLNLNIVGNDAGGYVFQGRNPATDDVEFSAPAESFSMLQIVRSAVTR